LRNRFKFQQIFFIKLLIKCNTLIFISMSRKTHKLIVRITENQLKWLTDVLIQEHRTKSQVLREALNQYMIEKKHCYEINEYTNIQTKTKR